MLVRNMIKAIVNNELKIKDLAESYGSSDRTIQTKIKKLGFKWDAKEAKYIFIGNDKSIFDLKIDDVFKSKANNINSSRNEINTASIEAAITLQETIHKTPETTSNNKSIINSFKNINNATDNIDRLLAGKKAKKTYRGFYFENDVLAIIDSVDNGVKSELINECLRKVFKDKGLL